MAASAVLVAVLDSARWLDVRRFRGPEYLTALHKYIVNDCSVPKSAWDNLAAVLRDVLWHDGAARQLLGPATWSPGASRDAVCFRLVNGTQSLEDCLAVCAAVQRHWLAQGWASLRALSLCAVASWRGVQQPPPWQFLPPVRAGSSVALALQDEEVAHVQDRRCAPSRTRITALLQL